MRHAWLLLLCACCTSTLAGAFDGGSDADQTMLGLPSMRRFRSTPARTEYSDSGLRFYVSANDASGAEILPETLMTR